MTTVDRAEDPVSPETVRNKLSLDARGFFQDARVETLSVAEIEWWLGHRLTGTDEILPIADGRGERIGDRPVDLHSVLEHRGRADVFCRALGGVVRTFLAEPEAWTEHPDRAFDLLDIVERTRCDDAFDEIFRLAESRALAGVSARATPARRTDLHRKLLFVLSALNKRVPEPFWLRNLDDPAYTDAAFFGLCRMNEGRALVHLPRYASRLVEQGRTPPIFELDTALVYLSEQCTLARIIRVVGDALQAAPDGARRLVLEAFERLFEVRPDDVEARAAGPLVDQFARYVARRGRGGPYPLLEPALFIDSIDDTRRRLVFEGAFARYIWDWTLHPTIDSTSLALHCLRELGMLESWLPSRRDAVLHFIAQCLGDFGFGIAPSHLGHPSLYATVNGLGAIKAVAGIPQAERLCERVADAEHAVGQDVVRRAMRRADALVRRCTERGGGIPIDALDDEERTLHALDFALAILWNIQPGMPTERFDRATVERFLESCRRTYVDATGRQSYGFVSKPDSAGGHRSPCTTTTSLVLRLYSERSDWRDMPFPVEGMRDFFLAMRDDGGFRVFPEAAPTLSATYFSLEAVRRTFPSSWPAVFDVTAVRAFVDACRRNGGYAFSSDEHYRPTVHATKYALGVLKRIAPDPSAVFADDLREGVSRFLASVYVASEGGFFGYERPSRAEVVSLPAA
jgi:hypothetical protein